MAKTIPKNLIIIQPSRTAIQYTVTNRPLPSTTLGKTFLLTEHIFRLGIGLWGLLTLFVVTKQQWATWRDATTTPTVPSNVIQQSPDGTISTAPIIPTTPQDTLFQILLHPFTPHPTVHVLYPALSLLLFFLLSRIQHTTTESLLVLQSLGLQTEQTVTSFPILIAISQVLYQRIGWDLGLGLVFGSTTTRFLPTSQVQDVLVHEAFVGWEVRHFLGIVVRGEDAIVVVFERCLPRLDVVECVWKGVRKGLWANKASQGTQKR